MVKHTSLSRVDRHRIAKEVKEALEILGISDSELARRAGVDQPMIFNIKNGRFKKHTARTQRLELYIHMALNRTDQNADRVQTAVQTYLASGGTVDVLCSAIEILAQAFRNRS